MTVSTESTVTTCWRSGLVIDPDTTARMIQTSIRSLVHGLMRRRGVVVALSGGVDSSVVAALSVRALGAERVLALLMPERDSSVESLELGRRVARHLGIEAIVEDIAPTLEALGCYRRQDEAVREVFPEYGEGWSHKLVLPPLRDGARLNVFRLVVESPDGERRESRMPVHAYSKLVAATSLKKRTRNMLAHYHAERLGRAVAGTPDRLKYDQGFFVKYGDGAADIMPIAHLYKTQVHALAEHLGLPEQVWSRLPTTDVFSMSQTQEELYFALPFDQLDACLFAHNHRIAPQEVSRELGMPLARVEAVFRDIEAKRRTTRHLHRRPLLVESVPEVVG